MIQETPTLVSARVSHEAFFAALMRVPEYADEFVRRHLPADVVDQLADALPRRLPTRHLTPNLRQPESDHVFLLRLKEGNGCSHILVVVEHQSRVHSDMARRTFRYEALLTDRLETGELDEPVPVFILVAYRGTEEWSAEQTLEGMDAAVGAVDDERSTRHRYYLCDLCRMDKDELAEDPVFQGGLLLLICEYGKETSVDEVARLLEPFPSGSLLEEMALAYILKLSASKETFLEGARRAKSRRGEEMMESFIDSLCREKHHEGREEGQVRMLLVMLQDRFGRLPETAVSQVNAATSEQLEEWAVDLLHPERADRLFRRWNGNGRSPAT